MMSMAFTKNSVTKGMISVSQGQLVKMAKSSAAVEIKNNSQYVPFDFFCASMS